MKPTCKNKLDLIQKYCLNDDLSTYDPYDIWNTPLGSWIKRGYNKSKSKFLLPAGLLTLFDLYLNNQSRFFYSKREYANVRALSAISLINIYKVTGEEGFIQYAQKHVEWLLTNRCQYQNGYGWGISFDWPITSKTIYNKDTPLSTHSVYAIEAIYLLNKIKPAEKYKKHLEYSYEFFEKDLQKLHSGKESQALSYGPYGDIIVTNVTSYALFAYSIFYKTFDNKKFFKEKIIRFYNFILKVQRDDGSWLYAPFESDSFIDCFHSAITIKNLIKTDQYIDFDLPQLPRIINKAYLYLKRTMFDDEAKLFKRFSEKNKPSIIKFDLYDNAEMLNLSILLRDNKLISLLDKNIAQSFINNQDIYTKIDIFGHQKNKNMLRWAVLPLLHAYSNQVYLECAE